MLEDSEFKKKLKLQFPSGFFEEETRCGYKITPRAKKIWAVELDLLNELMRVCNKHNIKMTVYAGTLLGAIRHKGMIPWDDDIDVCLNREEYNKLCEVGPKEFKFPYFFQNYKTDPKYLFGFSRLRNSLTTGHIIGKNDINYNSGIYIDIFVLDGYIEDERLIRKQIKKMDWYLRLASVYQNNNFSNSSFKKYFKGLLLFVFSPLLRVFVKYNTIEEAYQKSLQMYNASTNRVSLMTHSFKYIRKYWCYKEDLDKITYVPFENLMVPAPTNYHKMLSNMYGNYMEYPPVEKRGLWHDGKLELDPDTPYQVYMNRINSNK